MCRAVYTSLRTRCVLTLTLTLSVLSLTSADRVLAQSHTTGLALTKTCEPVVAVQGATVTCTVTIENQDPDHGVVGITVTNEVPFTVNPNDPPGPTSPVAGCATSLGPNDDITGSGTDFTSCQFQEVIPISCSITNEFILDQVIATGTDAAPAGSGFEGLPVSGSATNAVTALALVCPDDNNVCNGAESCQAGVGCVSGPPLTCPSDNNACNGPETCDPDEGCVSGPPLTCSSDNNACNGPETCDPAQGCVSGPPLECDDNDDCTDDSCDPAEGCVSEPNDLCLAICRTPGFFKNHPAVTQSLINTGGPLQVCGEVITNVAPGDNQSALEAMCISPKGDQTLQLARQLTAAALNCILSEFGPDCSGGPVAELFAACNSVCVGIPDTFTVGDCIDQIDAFNNGNSDLAPGCHDQELPFSSGKANPNPCKQAQKNDCTIFTCP